MTEVFKGKLSANTLTGDYVRVVTREQMALESAVVEAAVKEREAWKAYRAGSPKFTEMEAWHEARGVLSRAVDELIASRGETKGSSQDDLTLEDREHVPCEESK